MNRTLRQQRDYLWGGGSVVRTGTLDRVKESLDENDKTKIDYEQLNHMVDAFLDAGFTYFDTAYPYHGGWSERAVKECLVKRHE